MIIIFLVVVGACSMIYGRLLFGRWFNHITIYCAVWTASLALFELDMVHYYPLDAETWIVIVTGWGAFMLGATMIVASRFSAGVSSGRNLPIEMNETDIQQYLRILWVLNIVAAVGVFVHWYILLRKFGGVGNVIVAGNLIYSMRVKSTLPEGIPYLSGVPVTGSFLSGIFTAKTGRIKLVAFIPLGLVAIDAIAGMARAALLIALILFSSGYLLSKTAVRKINRFPVRRGKDIIAFALAIVILVGAAELVRSRRGSIENLGNASAGLQHMRNNFLITPSVYLYMSVHPGVLNQYLKHESENAFFGQNTFAPFYRVLSKLGFDTYVGEFQTFYCTPTGANTGTYLREVHADFGNMGVVIIPFLLGMICSVLYFRVQDHWSIMNVALLCHFYVVVFFSFFVEATRLGYWLFSLMAAVAVGNYLDRRIRAGAPARSSRALQMGVPV